ncbi:MAG: hypothetical protein KGH65_05520, partial [Candidatus Micrarchaeota archaeon]|nr:hypothetical protein [Candidatus Micrarchaeota archaeon]
MPRRVIAYRNPFDLQLGLLNICKEPLLISEITRNANLSNSLAVRTLESLGSFGMIKSFSSEDVPRTFRLLGNSRNVFMRTEKGSDAIRLFEEIQTLFKEPVKNFKLALDVLIHLDNPSNQTGITSAVRRDAPTTRGAIENLTACGMIV